MNKVYRFIDGIKEWWRWPQPTRMQKELLGKYTDVIDTDLTMARLASEDSARYILENMRTTPNFKLDYDLRDWIVKTQLSSELLKDGLVCEFGVADGRTLNQFARLLPEKTIHGFDGFVGLPENWTSRMQKGFFARRGLPSVRDNCKLWVGWFEDTLPEFVEEHTEPLALLHVDGDLYSSAKTVLTLMQKQIVSGTVIIFDEYINYPGWQKDEFLAWQEHCKKFKVKYEYIGYVSRHQKVAVRVL